MVTRGVFLPPGDTLDDFFADLAGDRAAGEQVLGTVDLRCLGEYGGIGRLLKDCLPETKRRLQIK